MIKQIYTQLWNKRGEYIWIFLEQILVFTILLFCFIQMGKALEQYLHKGNLSVNNVFAIGIIPDHTSFSEENADLFREKVRGIKQRVQASGVVEAIHSGFYSVPLNRPASNNFQDSLIYKGQKYKFYIKASDDNFPKVFKPKMLMGTWYKNEAFKDGVFPAVVTETLIKELGVDNPIGMKLTYDGRDFRVTGVMGDFKTMMYDDPTPAAVFSMAAFKDTWMERNAEEAYLVKDGRKTDLLNLFWKEAASTFPGEGHQPFTFDLEELNRLMNMETYLMLLAIIIPTLFLIVFAFLGTFSLMYRQSKKAVGEYGLRMALGSTKFQLKMQVLLQSCLLSLVAILIGSFIGANIYLIALPEVKFLIFIASLIVAAVLMLLFAFISVWYPALETSKIQPAIALKQEE